MYKIVDKQYLESINELTNDSLVVLDSLVKDTSVSETLQVDKEFLTRLLSGYLLLYNKSIEHSIMPSPSKIKQFTEIIQ